MFKVYGRNPRREDLAKIKLSPNYKGDHFGNRQPTRVMAEESSFFKALINFLNKPKNVSPSAALPSVRTDLSSPVSGASLVWFGHSSYLIRVAGRNILVDPVFSGHASPFSFAVKTFAGSNEYQAADMPLIDLLILTHDHYDHMDYETLIKLMPRIFHICTPLGVGSHLRYWGFDKEKITELDWFQNTQPYPELKITCTPGRHFSGRGLKRAKTLWGSFVIEAEGKKIFAGGDSGYADHFREIGEKYGPFDLAVLEAGQYNTTWPEIHMMPEECVKAALDLQAASLMPVHWAKFALAFHAWNEPIERVSSAAAKTSLRLCTPMIGEVLPIGSACETMAWWRQEALETHMPVV